MDSQDRYDFFNADSFARETRLDRDVERETVHIPRYRKVVTIVEGPTTCPNAGAGLDHAQLKSDPSLWSELESIGTMPTYDEPGEPQHLELKQCNLCNTTLAKPVR